MTDIFFKCAACDNPLVVDEARRGMPVECPHCQASIVIPSRVIIHQCPGCGQRLMIAREMSGRLLHCSACRASVLAPGQTAEGTAEVLPTEKVTKAQPPPKDHDESRFRRKHS